jgi:hypothetical protein
MEPDSISCDAPYHYSLAQLKEVLEVGVGVLVRLATKWAILHHVDQTRLELKVHVSNIDVGSGSHVSSRGDGEVSESLFGHTLRC